MSSRAVHLVIDARPRGPRGLLAAEVVLGRSVLGHLLDLAVELATPSEPVVVHARAEDTTSFASSPASAHRGDLVFVSGPPRADATVLRTDRFYDAKRLRRGLRRGRSPESAVLWRLDRPESLADRRRGADPALDLSAAGKILGVPPGRAAGASGSARPGSGPMHLTLDRGGPHALGGRLDRRRRRAGWPDRSITALALALALVLDTADGRLARLQGTSSAFGRWLDQVLDELADLALHAAIAWAAFAATAGHRSGWSSASFTPRASICSWFSRSWEMSWRGDRVRPRHASAGSPDRVGRKSDPRTSAAVSSPARRGRAPDRPRRRALASLDRAGAPGPAGRSRWRLMRSISRPGPWPVRSGRGSVMPEPRLSVLVVAKNEAHNLADCLASASWADERVVVVDPASRDATLEIAKREADVVALRIFDDFASQRNAALALASGDWVLSIDADERVTPAARGRDPARHCRSRDFRARVPRADPQRDPGPPVRLFRDAARPAAPPVPPRFRALGRPGPRDGRARRLDRDSSRTSSGTRRSRPCRSSSTRSTITRRSRPRAGRSRRCRYRASDLTLRPALDVLQALRLQARVSRRRRGVHVLPVLGRLGGGAGLEAPRADPGEGGPHDRSP